MYNLKLAQYRSSRIYKQGAVCYAFEISDNAERGKQYMLKKITTAPSTIV